jgi:KipI family sensor histidine kinase inhibitor
MTPPASPSAPPEPRFLDAGDSALVVELGDAIDPTVNARILALEAAVLAAKPIGLVETVPTYRSLMVQFDPLTFDVDAFIAFARGTLAGLGQAKVEGQRWRVPVVYGGAFGIDLEEVAARHGITTSKLIEKHSAPIYRVYMIGFMPGFTYLGGLDQSIAVSRRPDPRPMTPAGTISIGGVQALVAGAAMPSGWHLLGRTPVRTFMATRTPAVLFAPGDEIVFQPIVAHRWEALEARAEAGEPVAEVIAR